ncbi:hypothetical protein DFP75_1062 [Marinomonas alcarazii]|uniref:Uncharacterized protein n=1 Tax=Marinomonas alcarazii TaxID=491949 RepID=A0A318UXH0_9GAMM|nr:hypothetical protein DFP75_1062 [Marinomonas alcarazii]
MIWVYFIVIYSLPLAGFFWLWQTINLLYVVFFPSKLINGYFSYKPDIVEIEILYRRSWIYWRNCLRYLFNIERPTMPWYAKINTIFCALGVMLGLWGGGITFLDEYLNLISLDKWMDILSANGLL